MMTSNVRHGTDPCIVAASLVFIIVCFCNGRIPLTEYGGIVVEALATPSTIVQTSQTTATTTTTTTTMNRSKILDKVTIRQIQTEIEDELRSVHDNIIFNALFINVPEHPNPKPWKQSSSLSSSNQLLPSNFPPGCLLRVGPNGAPSNDGFMDGDGFINCITFPPSSIHGASTSTDDTISSSSSSGMFSSTYVETRGRKLEESIPNNKKFLGTLGSVPYAFPLLGNLISNAVNFGTLQCQKDTCNTALGIHDGKILALMEQCPPCEIQVSRTGHVRTIADTCRLDNAIPWSPITGGSLSAHGRTCPINKERIHVSYDSSTKPYVRVDFFDTQYQFQRSVPVDVPLPTMVHDCAISNEYVVILDFPLTLRTTRFLKNQFPMEYEPEYGARIGLLHRFNTDGTVQWFECEPGIILHTVNAFDDNENNKVIVQALRSDPCGTKGYLEEYTASYLYEYELDLNSGTVVSERYLNPYEPVEFPIINPTYVGQKTNTAVYCSSIRSIGGPLLHHKQPVTGITISGVTKFALQRHPNDDYQKGDVIDKYIVPLPWRVVSEPTVVPKMDDSGGEYVLLIATKVVENPDMSTALSDLQSQVIVLDGNYLSDGPVWQCDLPHHVHYGLHSLFVDWESMV